jgi:hydroxymethylglutaryl-CoA reductase (NADPH)
MENNAFAAVPMQTIGPVKIIGDEMNDEVMVPLATYESPLWPSTNRGAKASRLCGGIRSTIIDERMTRSVLLEAPSALECRQVVEQFSSHMATLNEVIHQQSRYTTLIDFHTQVVGNLLYLRLEFSTGDASGHNMTTQAADSILQWLLKRYSFLKYVSVSANYCTDKKPTAVNGILGRGKYVVSELLVPRDICLSLLKTTPEKIVDLNIKKNLIGTNLAGGIRTANSHYANMLLAFYLATGQDAANIVEGSQGIVHCEVRGENLYFSVTVPNLIIGTVGNGKDLVFVKHNLELLGCREQREPGKNARRLAAIAAATILCGEISLMAAQTNPGELMRAHIEFERRHDIATTVSTSAELDTV